jgi:hypothetical protein
VPREDLVPPPGQSAAKLADLGWPAQIGEVVDEPFVPLGRERRVAPGVELADGFLGLPRGRDLTVRVACSEQTEPPVGRAGVELLRSDREPPDPVERIGLAATVARGVLLDPPTDIVHAAVGELDHVEHVRDLPGVREHRVKHLAVGAGQIERGPLDRGQPARIACCEPSDGR